MDKALIPLAQTSLRDPQEAAKMIMGLNLGRDVLWTGLALVAVINTFLILLVIEVSGPTMPLPGYFSQPLALFVLIAGLLALAGCTECIIAMDKAGETRFSR